MRKRLAAAVLGSFFLAGGGPGCQPTVNSVDVRPDGRYDWIRTDSALSDIASVERVNQTRADDLLKVTVDIRNLRSSYEGIQYQFIWMDEAGTVIQSPFTWRTSFVAGRQATQISEVAPDRRATQVRLELKRFIQ
jgi:uncharacterized protein YcfL